MDQTQHRGASLTAVAILVLALCFSSHASALNKSAHTSKAHLKWEYCDASHAYPSNVTAVRMDPFPPKAGDKIKLIVAGDHGKSPSPFSRRSRDRSLTRPSRLWPRSSPPSLPDRNR